MAFELHIVFDCADPDRTARFWLTALEGYTFPGSDPARGPDSPPPGYETWEAWADDQGMPEAARNTGRTIIDTEGTRPDIFFLRVPESKAAKNRVHLDLKPPRGLSDPERLAWQRAEVERLEKAGAVVVRQDEGSPVVMQDVEGNEFCVTG